MIYVPSHIVASHAGHCVFDGRQPRDYLALYEHLARKALDWGLPREVLVDTSGIHLSSFQEFGSQQAVETTLARLFLMVGKSGTRGTFLKRLGLRRWSDLAKPIRLHGRQCKATITYDVRERRLREPGPNDCHPGAIYGQSCSFLFAWDRRWRCVLHYGHSHDSSSWQISVRQGREALSTFVNVTAPQWLATVLEPEEWPAHREQRNRDYDSISRAVEVVFGWTSYRTGKLPTEALVDLLLDGHKPELTRRRLAALRRWKRADEAKEAARQAALKKETRR